MRDQPDDPTLEEQVIDLEQRNARLLAALQLALPRLHRHLVSGEQLAQINAAIAENKVLP